MRTTVNQIFDIISKDDVLQDLVQNYKNMLAGFPKKNSPLDID